MYVAYRNPKKILSYSNQTQNWPHYNFPQSLNGERKSLICSTCGVHVTVKHVLTVCQIYFNTRTKSNLPESIIEILYNHPQSPTLSNPSSSPN